MRNTLISFTNLSLITASEALLDKLGIKYATDVRGVTFDDYFRQNDFSYQYVEEAQRSVQHIWHIGYVINSDIQQAQELENNRYDTLTIFACEIKPEAKFNRGIAVDLTRAFNRVATRRVNSETMEMPVIVIMKQGNLLSIATCERSERKDGSSEKVGRVTILRNINCKKPHPGHCQILERVANDVSGSSTYEELHRKWFESFNIDILSDKFFEGYKAIYEDIIEYVTGKRMERDANKWVEKNKKAPCAEIMMEFVNFSDPEKTVRDYVKKLMGRLVFIQFLQKKGWMGVPAGDSWKGGDTEFLQNLFANSDKKETFIDDVLEPLFNDLNTPRHNDLLTFDRTRKVPYLNGGLFELDKSDDAKFPLPSHFIKKLFDFFASYNFTIDENAPDDVEIGVDPEMLGRIFENLLEDNKEKGAFYTPKEIVQYMCRESLIAYLTTCVMKKQGENHKPENDIRKAIRQLLAEPEVIVPRMTKEHLSDFSKYIREVKICDPAIGSGAFPMGLLNELVRCRAIISAWAKDEYDNLLKDDYAALKADIICNNIYGVDIEKGAIDIARLRFWLSIIVDEKAPHALPNFDFKFMQGNSLITTFNGKYVNLDTKNQRHTNVKKMNVEKHKLLGLKQQYYASQGKDKHGLAVEIKKSILRLISMQLGYELRSWYDQNIAQTTIDFDNNGNNISFSEIKSKLPQEKQELVNSAETLYKQLNDESIDIAKRAQIDINFFDWRMMFTEVFDSEDGNGGFDIIIGNPPYIRQERLNMEYKTLLTKIYPTVGNGTADILVYFFGLGLAILKNKGVLTFITSNKFLKTKYGLELRNTLANDVDVQYFIDFFELPVFHNASTDAGITLLIKQQPLCETRYYPVLTLNNLNLVKLTSGNYLNTVKKETEWQFVKNEEYSILKKIDDNTLPLGKFVNNRIYSGIKTGCNEAFVLVDASACENLKSSESEPLVKKYAKSTDICRWNLKAYNKYFLATGYDLDIPNDYPTAFKYLKQFEDKLVVRGDKGVNWYNLRACAYYDEFEKEKIIYIHTAKDHQFYFDTEGRYINNSCYMIITDSRFLFFFLNSKLFNYFKRLKFVAYGNGQGAGRCKLDYNKMITVPIKKDVDESPYCKIFDQIRDLREDPTNVKILENKVNRMIYELYSLTNAEVKLIDSNQVVTGGDEDMFKA